MIQFQEQTAEGSRFYIICSQFGMEFGWIKFYESEINIGLNEGKIYHPEDLPLITEFINKIKKEIEEEKKTPLERLLESINTIALSLDPYDGNELLNVLHEYRTVSK